MSSIKKQESHDRDQALCHAYLVDWRIEDEEKKLVKTPGGESDSDAASDAWDVDFTSNVTKWDDLTRDGKLIAVAMVVLKLTIIIAALYLFICSLSFLADGFRLVAGRQAGSLFRNSEVFNNPIAGMLVGVLVTVLVQSSSTSTSIVITMVAADLFTVRQAISLIMGANIGTSVTSTIVALTQSIDRSEFRRAFAAATVHDMFNFLTVLVFLPVEAATGYLFHFSGLILSGGGDLESSEKPPDILKALTKPFTKTIISIDKKVITKISVAETAEELAALEGTPMLKHFFGVGPDGMSDGVAGTIILIAALVILCTMLFTIVWTLKSLLKGRVAVWLHRSVNGNVPDFKIRGITIPLGWLSGYLAMAVGLFVTILVQSSSITTSALTPLVGVGVINVERMYPTVLGANIGTCITGVLAALAADGAKLYLTLRVACSHLLFNISGIILWYVVWPLRSWPIEAAKFLGNTTAQYRWFALAYLVVCFFLMPGIFMAVSLASTAACIVLAAIIVGVAAFVVIVTMLQSKRPTVLPPVLRTWEWLPIWLRSLGPIDRALVGPIDRMICAPLGKTCCAWCPKSSSESSKAAKSKKAAAKKAAHEIEVAAARLGSVDV